MPNNAPAPAAKTYEEVSLGDEASFRVTVDQDMVRAFAALSGDMNPLHLDAGYAAGTPFKEPIAHGMIVGALFSRLVGMHLPGRHALYLSQTLQFREPVRIGADIIIRGVVSHKTDAHRAITLRTTAEDGASGKALVTGEAIVRMLR